MTRRERTENRIEKRRSWATSRRIRSDREFESARKIADGIPFGQPILVGHHSERHARRDQERIHNGMSRAVESHSMANHHESVANNIEAALERTIFSDDHNAIEALKSRIAERKGRADRIVALNKLIRKEMKTGLTEGWLERIGATEEEKRAIASNLKFGWMKSPLFAGYVMSNLRKNIKTDEDRIKQILYRAEKTSKAEAAGGVIITKSSDGGYCSVTFAEKPDRDILNALRNSNFHWSGGSWHGQSDKLPKVVTDMVEEVESVPTETEESRGPEVEVEA